MTAKELLDRQCCGRASCKCYRAASAGHGLTHCPAHDDRTPSLNVQQEGETTVWRCHAGCTQEAVTAAIAELAERQAAAATAVRRVVAFYDYRDEAGELLYQVLRYRPKDFRQRKPDGDGSWSWSLNGVRRVLYHLPELVAAKPRRWVLLVEGEKDADRLFEAGILATCYAGGAKAPWVKEWTEQLRGRRVAIIPDADRPGLARARRDAKKLAGICAELKVVALPGLEVKQDHGEDVSDWLEQGHELSELKQLVDSAPVFDPAESPLQTEAAEPQPVVDDVAEQAPGRLVVYRLPEYRGLPAAELSWVVDRFCAAGGITELTAYVKVGKSTLMTQLIAAVLHGEAFFGSFGAQAGPVVLMSEEPPSALIPALEDAGITDQDPVYLVPFRENAELPWAEAATAAAALCREHGARLLVVDTLSIWARVEDEGDSSQAHAAMRWLMHVASTGVSVLMLRQARKSGGEIHNAGRGSGAYSGAADILLHLDYQHDDKGRPQEESTRRVLRLKSRFEREHLPPMQLDYEHGRYWSTEPIVTVSQRLEALQRRVLTALEGAAEELSTDQIRRLVPSRKSDLLHVLHELVEAGRLARTERQRPAEPYRYAAVPTQPELQGTTGTMRSPAPAPAPARAVPVGPTGLGNNAGNHTPGDVFPRVADGSGALGATQNHGADIPSWPPGPPGSGSVPPAPPSTSQQGAET